MAADPAVRDSALLSIGEVLSQLRAEFPDTTISKLRFLETEGLVQPQRTPSGYRKYSREDVARLRYVLAAQRDQYLPLRVIRQQLDAGAHLPPARPALVALPAPPAGPGGSAWESAAAGQGADAPASANRMTHEQILAGYVHAEPTAPRGQALTAAAQPSARIRREDLCERAGIGEGLLADLERHGLITERAGGWYDADALTVAEVAGMLAAYGIEPRHLRPYKVAADREAGLLAQVVAPLLRQQSPAREARADEALRELLLLSQRLHLALLRSGLSETLGP